MHTWLARESALAKSAVLRMRAARAECGAKRGARAGGAPWHLAKLELAAAIASLTFERLDGVTDGADGVAPRAHLEDAIEEGPAAALAAAQVNTEDKGAARLGEACRCALERLEEQGLADAAPLVLVMHHHAAEPHLRKAR